MKRLFLILIISIICISCGKKGDPKYQSFDYKNNIVQRT